jgi:sodium/potassium/calcium exchanger 6
MRDVDGSAGHQRSLTQLPSFSLLGAIEFRQVISSLQKDSATSALSSFDLPISPFAAAHYHSHFHFRSHSPHAADPNSPLTLHATTQTRHEDEIDPWDASLGLPLSERRDLSPGSGSPPTSPPALAKIQPPAIRLDAPSESYSPTPSEFLGTRSAAPQPRSLSRFQKTARRIRETFHVLFPTLHNFRSKTIIGKLVSLYAAPAVLALTLTLPVVISSAEGSDSHPTNRGGMDVDHPSLIDFEEEGVERTLTAETMIEEDLHEAMFNKWLVAVQCALGPVFCAMVLFSKHLPAYIPLII